MRLRGRAAFGGLALAVILMCFGNADGAEHAYQIGAMKLVVWSEPREANAPSPVIIFSHGFHGCATQSRFLMNAFAAAGYIVFAPNHRDATCGGGQSSWRDRSQDSFTHPAEWTDQSYKDRAEDISRVIEIIRSDERFRTHADLERVALCDHSLGGYTVLGMAGAWKSWRLPGIKAVLALSPYSQPFVVQRTLPGLSAPVMYQGGTWDFGITPGISKSEGAYDQSPAPKYFVEFERAGHFAWTDLRTADHDEIDAYAVAFMNRYVKGAPGAALLTHSQPGVFRLRYDEGSNP